jgi:hypothetical protein
MTVVKLSDSKYINVDRMTYVESKRRGKMVVHFAVGGGDIGGPSCNVTLEEDEAERLKQWLDARS